jgi:hypothetical protein
MVEAYARRRTLRPDSPAGAGAAYSNRMKLVRTTFLVLACSAALPAAAGPGDVYVPAHRTANGLWVPANVPPSSGGTRMAKKLPARPAKAPATTTATPSTSTASPAMPPLFVATEPIRR